MTTDNRNEIMIHPSDVVDTQVVKYTILLDTRDAGRQSNGQYKVREIDGKGIAYYKFMFTAPGNTSFAVLDSTNHTAFVSNNPFKNVIGMELKGYQIPQTTNQVPYMTLTIDECDVNTGGSNNTFNSAFATLFLDSQEFAPTYAKIKPLKGTDFYPKYKTFNPPIATLASMTLSLKAPWVGLSTSNYVYESSDSPLYIDKGNFTNMQFLFEVSCLQPRMQPSRLI